MFDLVSSFVYAIILESFRYFIHLNQNYFPQTEASAPIFADQVVSLFVSFSLSFIGYLYWPIGLKSEFNESNYISFIVGNLIYHYQLSYRNWHQYHDDDYDHHQSDRDWLAHPTAVLIHHVITYLYLNGCLIVDSKYATLIFTHAELPVFLIAVSWFLEFFGHKQTDLFITVRQMILITYLYRVIIFGMGSFLFGILNFKFTILDLIKIAPLLLGLAMNVYWFYDLLKKDTSGFLKPKIFGLLKIFSFYFSNCARYLRFDYDSHESHESDVNQGDEDY